jgi:hypothetical protein
MNRQHQTSRVTRRPALDLGYGSGRVLIVHPALHYSAGNLTDWRRGPERVFGDDTRWAPRPDCGRIHRVSFDKCSTAKARRQPPLNAASRKMVVLLRQRLIAVLPPGGPRENGSRMYMPRTASAQHAGELS